MEGIRYLLFDWGDTLMVDDTRCVGPMEHWETVSPMPGVAERLPALAAALPCAVASNAGDSDSAAMERAFRRAGLAGYFRRFVTSRELGVEKPDPRFFRECARLLGAEPGGVCMIGNDYEKDIAGAKAVGMYTVLIDPEPGHHPLADHVIRSFYDLPDVLGLANRRHDDESGREGTDMSPVETALQLIESQPVSFIGGVDGEGFPTVKAMLRPRKWEGLGTIWYSTNTSSRRVAQYRQNPKACVYFCDPANPARYLGVMLQGTMEVLEDAASKEALWEDGDEMYYPQGVTDPDYCVLRFTAQKGRLFDGSKAADWSVDFSIK